MDITLPRLDAVNFESCPTEEELIRLLREHKEFWGKTAGLLITLGKYSVADPEQKMSKLLGLAVQMQMVIDAFQGRSNIAVPQPHLVQGQR